MRDRRPYDAVLVHPYRHSGKKPGEPYQLDGEHEFRSAKSGQDVSEQHADDRDQPVTRQDRQDSSRGDPVPAVNRQDKRVGENHDQRAHGRREQHHATQTVRHRAFELYRVVLDPRERRHRHGVEHAPEQSRRPGSRVERQDVRAKQHGSDKVPDKHVVHILQDEANEIGYGKRQPEPVQYPERVARHPWQVELRGREQYHCQSYALSGDPRPGKGHRSASVLSQEDQDRH
jgi:hypothetical protein